MPRGNFTNHPANPDRYRNPLMACRDGRHPAAKLDDATVRRVRRRSEDGVSTRDLAAPLGVCVDTIVKLLRRQTYADVP